MHPRILNAISQNILVQEESYGYDSECSAAKELILSHLDNLHADIHFVVGATLANLLNISAILRPYESVIAATQAHIHVHETGAIEGTGHKINLIESNDGKLSTTRIEALLKLHHFEHMTSPRLVCLSNSTELGTVYSKQELEEISEFCRRKKLLLYVDGARLGQALCSTRSAMSLAEFSSLVDIFTIGGTKNGGILGEAIVICTPEIQDNFRYHMKHRGALLAKSRILGAQFREFFRDGLFFSLASHANAMAHKLAVGIQSKGYKLASPQDTNMIFPIFPSGLITHLEKKFLFYTWSPYDNDSSIVRLVCSWATEEARIEEFISSLPHI